MGLGESLATDNPMPFIKGAVGGFLLGTIGKKYDPLLALRNEPDWGSKLTAFIMRPIEWIEQGIGYTGQVADALSG